jgi:excisionase family DNA binding protein
MRTIPYPDEVAESRRAYRNKILQHKATQKLPARFMTVKKFSEITGCSKHTVYAWIKKKNWHENREFVRKGRLVMIDLRKVEKWFQK